MDRAIEFEQDILKQSVGYQDSAWAVYGGFNTILFEKGRKVTVVGTASENFINDLEKYCLLMYTGIPRMAKNLVIDKLLKQVERLNKKIKFWRSQCLHNDYTVRSVSNDHDGWSVCVTVTWTEHRRCNLCDEYFSVVTGKEER